MWKKSLVRKSGNTHAAWKFLCPCFLPFLPGSLQCYIAMKAGKTSVWSRASEKALWVWDQQYWNNGDIQRRCTHQGHLSRKALQLRNSICFPLGKWENRSVIQPWTHYFPCKGNGLEGRAGNRVLYLRFQILAQGTQDQESSPSVTMAQLTRCHSQVASYGQEGMRFNVQERRQGTEKPRAAILVVHSLAVGPDPSPISPVPRVPSRHIQHVFCGVHQHTPSTPASSFYQMHRSSLSQVYNYGVNYDLFLSFHPPFLISILSPNSMFLPVIEKDSNVWMPTLHWAPCYSLLCAHFI